MSSSKPESLPLKETPSPVSLSEYLSTHLDFEDVAEDINGFGPELVEELIADFCLGFDHIYLMATNFPDIEFFIYFDHPTRYYSYLENLHRTLKNDGWDPGLGNEELDYLYRRCFYAYLAFGLGLAIPPKTREEMTTFEEKYLGKDIEIRADEVGQEQGIVFACEVRPLAEVSGMTIYQRKWVVRASGE